MMARSLNLKAGSIASALVLAAVALAGLPTPATAGEQQPSALPAAMAQLLDYVHSRNTTGFLIVHNDRTVVEKNWPAPVDDAVFANFAYEKTGAGELLEDVASQQKSFVSVLVAIAIDKGLIDVTRPVSAYLGQGWSKASPAQEARIRVLDLLTMSSGLDDKLAYHAPPGAEFHYNTPAYAMTKRIIVAAARQPLETITRDWLTVPLGMNDTAWRRRPDALASVGNDTGLVTSPRDTAKFGLMILRGGRSASGKRLISEGSFNAMFQRSASNPAYGRLWWLNGGAYRVSTSGERLNGELVPGAPADMVCALGALDRRLCIVPSRHLVVVRTGAAVHDKDFDQQLWRRVMRTID